MDKNNIYKNTPPYKPSQYCPVVELRLSEQYTHKLWQVVNQLTINAIFYQIIKSACRHLIFSPLVLTGKTGSLEKPCFVFIEVTGKVECV